MSAFGLKLPPRLRKILRRKSVAREIDDEMRLHIELETEDLVLKGLSRNEARRQAALSFGGVARYTDEAKDAWPLRTLGNIAADVGYAARSLRRSPSFTIAATLALAVAMGANASVFSVADSIAFRALPVPHPQELVAVYGTQGEATLLGVSYPTYEDLRRDARGFSELAAFTEGPVSVSVGADPAALWAMHTTDNYFSTLGVTPYLGTFFRAGDRDAPVVVLSHASWSTRFARDPSIVGRALLVNGSRYTIIGVAPEQFTGTRLFTFDPALWIPIGMHGQTIPGSNGLLTERRGGRLSLIGRLQSGITVRQARESADAVMRRLSALHPDLYRGFHTSIVSNRTPINPWLAAPDRVALIARLMVVGAALVLLVACVNVASLFVARMLARRQEIATRLSLGASRARIVQQVLSESAVLASLGALAAIPVRIVVGMGLQRLTPTLDYTSTFRPQEDARVWLYSILLTATATMLFGLGPALQAARRSVVVDRRIGGGRVTSPRVREWLLVGQVAVSVTVLAVAGLLARSVAAARLIDPGFDPDGAVTFTLDPGLSPSYDAERSRLLYQRVSQTLVETPGVLRVGRAVSIPLDGNSMVRRVFMPGRTSEISSAPVVEYGLSAPGFFAALGTPMIEGREFAPGDTGVSLDPAVINDVLAQRLFPNESAIGKRIRLESTTGPLLEVIGVVQSGKYRSIGESPRSAVWRNLDRGPRLRSTIVVRTTMSNTAAMSTIRDAVSAIDPALPVLGLGTLRSRVSLSFIPIETGALGATGFAVLALILVASGIYGIIAYGISQRRREIGIRVALGARRSGVVRLVTHRALMMTVIGMSIGLVGALFVPMGFDTTLYGIARRDFPAIGLASVALIVVAVLAAAIPAWHALRVSPSQALRLD